MMAQNALRTSIEEKQRATFTSFPADFKHKLDTQETWREDKRRWKDDPLRWSVTKKDGKLTRGFEKEEKTSDNSFDESFTEQFFDEQEQTREGLHILKLDGARGLVDVDTCESTT